jgi:hypothetical protein
MIETKLVPSGELHAVIHLLTGFLNDLTPEPDRAEDVEVPADIISALAALAQTLTPKNDEEIAEISFMLETLDALKRDYYRLPEGQSDEAADAGIAPLS